MLLTATYFCVSYVEFGSSGLKFFGGGSLDNPWLWCKLSITDFGVAEVVKNCCVDGNVIYVCVNCYWNVLWKGFIRMMSCCVIFPLSCDGCFWQIGINRKSRISGRQTEVGISYDYVVTHVINTKRRYARLLSSIVNRITSFLLFILLSAWLMDKIVWCFAKTLLVSWSSLVHKIRQNNNFRFANCKSK